ncbi:hypothetical protein GCM10025777_11110 [Membranihabitans marinus]
MNIVESDTSELLYTNKAGANLEGKMIVNTKRYLIYLKDRIDMECHEIYVMAFVILCLYIYDIYPAFYFEF